MIFNDNYFNHWVINHRVHPVDIKISNMLHFNSATPSTSTVSLQTTCLKLILPCSCCLANSTRVSFVFGVYTVYAWQQVVNCLFLLVTKLSNTFFFFTRRDIRVKACINESHFTNIDIRGVPRNSSAFLLYSRFDHVCTLSHDFEASTVFTGLVYCISLMDTWKGLLWFSLFQVLRVLVQLYLNLGTPDFISVCQVC